MSTYSTNLERSESLDEKVRVSLERMRCALERCGPESAAVAWTGGKDSTVVLHLYRRILRESFPNDALVAINLDTGCKFPEVLRFRDETAAGWGVRLHVLRPAISLEGYPLAVDKVACCRELKIEPLKRGLRELGTRLLFTGIRSDEHESRAGRSWMEERTDPEHLSCNPILHWSEMDVWAYHSAQGLAYCPLYEKGYRSLGCIPCTGLSVGGEGERSGRDGEKERQLEQLRALGYF
jgi:phosphoadenosine phosphosulfate reductase